MSAISDGSAPTCFVISSFSRAMDDLFDAVAEAAADLGYRAVRADTVQHTEEITSVIHDQIRQAQFVVADLSDPRPNVYYEVGFARGLGKAVVLTCRNDADVAFDLRNVSRVIYQTYRELKQQLRVRVEGAIGRAESRPAVEPEPAERPSSPRVTAIQDFIALYTSQVEAAVDPEAKAAALINRARVFTSARMIEQAIEDLEEAIDLSEHDAQALVELGYVYNAARRFEEALRVLQRAQELAPENSKAWTHAAYALNGLGRHSEALVAAEQAISIDSTDGAAERVRDYAQQQLSAPMEVVHEVPELEHTDELTIDSLLLSARSYIGRGQLQSALGMLDRAAARDDAPAVVFHERARVLRSMGQRVEALEAFEKAAGMEPASWQYQYDYGTQAASLGKTNEALSSYRKALSLEPSEPAALAQIGYALSKAGDRATSLAAYTKALAIQPDYMLALLGRGFVYNLVGERENALADYDRAVSVDPSNAKAHIQRAYTLSGLARFAEAREAVQLGLTMDPRNPEGTKVLAGILARMGSGSV